MTLSGRFTKIRFVFLLILISLALSSVVIAATDQRGLAVRPKAPTGEIAKGDQWLLTIGIDTYLAWPRLKTAANDAKALKNILLERYHVDPFHVIELYNENATRKNILGSLRDLSKKVKPEDSLLIFYAGHGHIDNITKKGSWIPVESGTDDPSAWISNQDVKDYLNIDAIKAKHVLLVSDSCFSGDFFRGTRGALPQVTDAVIKKAYQRSSRQAITSGGLEPVSDAGFGGNSVFSHFLVTALKNNTNPYLIPSELFPAIKSGVAQNAEQFPQLGSLYGVGGQDGGELVLFLKTENRLGNLSAGSAARQKELEQLKKAEAEDAAAKRKEQAEIAKKQAELDMLDKQIAEMKSRLGSNAARSSDSLDAIVALADQKAEQGNRLEELRKQREADEQKRQQEIERLKQEAIKKRNDQILADVAKYQKVAANKYAQDMKDVAWDALITTYPEGKEIVRFDVNALLVKLDLKKYTYKQSGLIWAMDGNIAGMTMTFEKAIRWVKQLNYSGNNDWRLPTKDELVAFLAKNTEKKSVDWLNSIGFRNIQSGSYWTSSVFETTNKYSGNAYWSVYLENGQAYSSGSSSDYYVWPVRDAK